jgi:shikimate kinase
MGPTSERKSLIFLAGFMGSGKTTIGPILANALGWDFVDIDKEIEQQTNQPIVDIFATSGEKAFRELEHHTIGELVGRADCVISLGGGTLVNEENFELIRKSGVIVYLRLSPEKIMQRVKRKTDRPMLKDAQGRKLEGNDLQKRIESLLESREPYYSKADIIIPADDLKVGMTVDEIVRRLRGIIRT